MTTIVTPIYRHIFASDDHRACVIAFRTPPTDSTGLPHILEHTTLCGSQRFPVRDPFFNMLRRSLATFLNAMTWPDFTAYPFATQSGKDFDNLLRVYLDAVFAPRLDERDFHQEGHRLAPDGQNWSRQGVVFNEMLGALGSTDAQIDLAVSRALLPDTCHRHEYGGDPVEIPRLRHADLVAFHRRCYRPANAIIITYGDVDPALIQDRMAPYLGDPGMALPAPGLQKPLTQAQTLLVPVPWTEGQEILDVSSASMSWCWGDTASIDEVLEGDLLDRLLLGHAGSPLRRALESSGLGRGLGGSGYQAHGRNGIFQATLDGIDPADYPRLEPLVLETLDTVVRNGLPDEEMRAALHQLELSRREVRGDGHPYGLELCFRCLPAWNHGVDPAPFLDPAPALAALRKRALAPGWLEHQVKRRLLDNQHRALATAQPDRSFHERIRARVGEIDRAELAVPGAETKLREQAQALSERQASVDDVSILPRLDIADIPASRRWAQARPSTSGNAVFVQPTNGLLHLVAALPLPLDDEVELLPLLAAALGGLGCGQLDYAAQSARLNGACGGLYAWTEAGGDPSDTSRLRPWFFLEIKGLAERADDFLPLLAETLLQTRFDEADRLGELIDEALTHLQERVLRSGSSLAASVATRSFAGSTGLGHRLSGLGRLAWLKRISSQGAGDLGKRLEGLRDRVAASLPRLAIVGDSADRIRVSWPERPVAYPDFLQRPAATTPPVPIACTTATSVNHCALAFPVPALCHPDSAALAVGARLLTNRWLHPRIRERGGAYGGSASAGGGSFVLSSYRDPRLADTYADMRAGLRWLADAPAEQLALEESILGVIQGLDAPGSPAGEARRRFIADLTGRGPEIVDAFRKRVIATSLADIRRAAATWLPAEGGAAACITNDTGAATLGWTREPI